MSGGGGSQTVGYKYHLGIHMVLCHGPIDHLCNIKVDGRLAWTGQSEGGREEFDAQLAGDLFGGDKREGGIGGEFDVDMGGPTQEQNLYLIEQLGADVPAFRGVASIVLNQCYVGNNPYLKAWSFCAQRIHVRQDGVTQWYDEKAAIGFNPLESEAYQTLVDWADADEFAGGLYGEWYREPIVGTTPVADGPFGTYWRGTYQSGDFRDIKDPSIPIGNVTRFYGSVTMPPLTARAFIRVRLYHDDFMDGGISVNGASAITLEKDSYYNSHIDIVVPANDESSVISFSYKVIQGVPSGTTTGFGGGYYLRVLPPEEYYTDNGQPEQAGCSDMNPAHIIRECLTDPDWGMGYLDTDIDDTAFMAAADALYAEWMGMSLLWDRQMPLEEFIAEILRHIDGVLYVDRVTGKFILNLIRDDYALSNLITLDESNVSEVSNARRPTIGELTNSVTVSYYDKDNESSVGSVGAQDQALIAIQGATIGTNIQYTGFTNYNTAARVAERDLKALSIPLLSAEIVASREAADLNVGDPFIFTWPDLDIDAVVMRVQYIAVGDNKDNSVKISAVEDVFSLSNPSQISTIAPETGLWIDPTTVEPLPALPRLVTEAPYYTIVQDRGQLATDTVLADEADAGFLLVAGGRQGSELNANLLVDSGAGYVDSDVLDFAPYAYLSSDAWYSDVNFYYSGGVDLDEVVVGSIAQINDEIVRVDAIVSDSSGTYITVGRGALDTVPGNHIQDSNGWPAIIFWGNYASSDEVQYTASDVINAKIQTALGSSILAEASTPFDSVTMDSRAIRPYPPGDLKVNADRYPYAITGAAAFTWVHRDRLQQTSGTIYDSFDSGIGPEATTTYTLRVYGETGTLLHTESGLTGTSFTYALADELIDSEITGGDSLYQYIFSTSGSFTLSGSKEITMLVVGGGGAGGTDGGGGGGGGGTVLLTRTLGAGSYTVTVGAGGAATGTSSVGADGGASSIDSFIDATGGQGGRNGGGGGAGGDSGAGSIDSIVVNASNADGGTGTSSNAGGGGGAGAVGSAPTGGDGALYALFGEYYGGGGGGSINSVSPAFSSGGLGGGGRGSQSGPTVGEDGLGGGGGGRWFSAANAGTAGGDGVVIVVTDDPYLSTTGTVSREALTGFRANSRLTVELESERGVHGSTNKYSFSFDRAGYGYLYGEYYGGV